MKHAGVWALAALVLLAAGSGCTKRVAWEEPLDSRKTMVLTFEDGSEIRGKINLDETVELTKDGAIYKGVIEEVNDEEIELRYCRFVRRSGGTEAAHQRMKHARVDLGQENIDSIIFLREEIVNVDRVQIDALKTASRSVFWLLSGAATAFLLSEKS